MVIFFGNMWKKSLSNELIRGRTIVNLKKNWKDFRSMPFGSFSKMAVGWWLCCPKVIVRFIKGSVVLVSLYLNNALLMMVSERPIPRDILPPSSSSNVCQRSSNRGMENTITISPGVDNFLNKFQEANPSWALTSITFSRSLASLRIQAWLLELL